MTRPAGPPHWLWALCALCLFATAVEPFSWGGDRGARESDSMASKQPKINYRDPPSPLRFHGRASDMYVVALSELQELESEPLCHRIAARLLVNNCQLLDGQDEATVLTDSGRATRDFVDSFAASLAICDLERGSFVIPFSCSKFREAVLAGMPVPSKPLLHVSPPEIDNCLQGLAQSDSAWNTWVSYRHKALRFCEAARADNEKDQNIHLYERITKILARLTTQVEAELETRFESLDKMFRDTSANLESITPQVDELRTGLFQVERIISEVVSRGAEEAAATVRDGLDDAKSLQQLLTVLLATVLDNGNKIARSHESALQVVSKQAGDEFGAVMATLGAAIISSASLQRELVESQSRAANIAHRQERIEAGMDRLTELADALTLKHQGHQERLYHAQLTAEQVLDTLGSVSASAGMFKNSLLSGLGFSRLWPYIFCPATSLIIGSYGLPPSATRNILLLGLGEAAGFIVSVVNQYSIEDFEKSTAPTDEGISVNSTDIGESFYASDAFMNDDILRRRKSNDVY
ncbi:Nuclear membrane fusion protein Kar5 [Tolypocladium paradoxum]|uniref:Nuclear membrane fusion protein Kar5 n=1 Tax=Tolypocladium paradoxum TaxID=94208 RepID=A0A2S4L791_9HYPO|nr:Nuclear membrane fusion protein Kar5 [Tolypocladium paradoxum]